MALLRKKNRKGKMLINHFALFPFFRAFVDVGNHIQAAFVIVIYLKM